jgi:hypothetical protein
MMLAAPQDCGGSNNMRKEIDMDKLVELAVASKETKSHYQGIVLDGQPCVLDPQGRLVNAKVFNASGTITPCA